MFGQWPHTLGPLPLHEYRRLQRYYRAVQERTAALYSDEDSDEDLRTE